MADHDEVPMSARVPADVERPDALVFGLTGRQAVIVGGVGVGLWLLYQASQPFLPPLVFLVIAVPVVGAVLTTVLIRRDGMSLDQLLAAALRHRRSPRRLVPASTNVSIAAAPSWVGADAGPLPAPLRLPAQAISAEGLVGLAEHGVAQIAACSTVNFGLRTPGEQNMLVAGFARWLHSLTGPAQILVRSDRLDVGPAIDALEARAAELPHPALERACLGHAAFLRDLAASRDLLRRRVSVVLREPARPGRDGRAAAGQVAARRAAEVARSLSVCEVAATPLDGTQAHAVLSAAADPNGSPARHCPGTAAGVVTGGAAPGAADTDSALCGRNSS